MIKELSSRRAIAKKQTQAVAASAFFDRSPIDGRSESRLIVTIPENEWRHNATNLF